MPHFVSEINPIAGATLTDQEKNSLLFRNNKQVERMAPAAKIDFCGLNCYNTHTPDGMEDGR
jgi:hypothetical protein